ncbi:MAG: TMEM165/GDT1 family protein [Chloroflexota bacterium]|nr:TMEM165/GDT1 family protein [Chloroflexota bacterium]
MLSGALLLGSSFLASAVEMVEALTIVLAVGLTHNWRTALLGVLAGFVALAAVVAALGPSLVHYVPLNGLRVGVGVLLLIFGLQWLRKAILRAAGLKAPHDEAQIFERELAELRGGAAGGQAVDWTGFVVSFKGVFLEGLEVAFIVLTFGTNSGRFDLAAAGALLAFVIVGATGAVVHRPLARVPENAIKFTVGLALVSFGTFWGGEGIGVKWAAGDATIVILAAIYALSAAAIINLLQRSVPPLPAVGGGSD